MLGESKACIHDFCENISWIVAIGRLRQRLEDNVKLMLPTEVGCEDGRWMELTLDWFFDSHVASFSSVTREMYCQYGTATIFLQNCAELQHCRRCNLYECYALPLNIIILTVFFLELAETQKHPILMKKSRPTALTIWHIQIPLK